LCVAVVVVATIVAIIALKHLRPASCNQRDFVACPGCCCKCLLCGFIYLSNFKLSISSGSIGAEEWGTGDVAKSKLLNEMSSLN